MKLDWTFAAKFIKCILFADKINIILLNCFIEHTVEDTIVTFLCLVTCYEECLQDDF